ncbi:hypothetical protein D9M70_610990 [compost metagenome]
MAGAAEQQAPVSRQAVIVQGHSLVAHGHVLRQQCPCLGVAQWLGGDDIAARRQHLAAESRVEVVQVGIAAQHQGIGAY